MKIQIANVNSGTAAATVKRNTTAGISSGYQRTNVTTSGAALVESADGYLAIELMGIPWPELLSFGEPSEINELEFLIPTKDRIAAKGYMDLSEENRILAEEFFSADLETWPTWEPN